MKKILISSVLALTLLSVTGCSTDGLVAPTSEVGKQLVIEEGVVKSVKEVALPSTGMGSTIGGMLGAVAGGVTGSQVGAGIGESVATVAGTVVGGVVGNKVGETATANKGQAVVVRLTSGKTVSTTLKIDEETPLLTVNQEVNVFFSGETISNVLAR